MKPNHIRLSARLNADETLAGRILKVNHAGEHGAICIYTGQILLARLTAPQLVAELREFLSYERRHRATFLSELKRRDLPRCRSYWFCGAGGLALGILTGLCGRRAIAATTVAVERVVLRHLAQQLIALRGRDQAAMAAISSIVEDEQKHHDHSELHLASGKLWPRVVTPLVAAVTEAVIWLGMHL
jgi:ubiquinone biosynthesis monooxygenase Coq7